MSAEADTNKSAAQRVILHCDLNAFFASAELMHRPELRDYPVAVCGETQLRHGIVLAKNQLAKNAGVKTGEVIWQARQKCPQLVTIPPHSMYYTAYSRMAQEIYCRYTPLVEPFGIDECWLDVTGSTRLFGSGVQIADNIRSEMKRETGLTVSVGVSFNKMFAKLGSDLKKPDAVTAITRESFREQIWPLPADSLMGVGPSVSRQLARIGLHTIGQLAQCPEQTIQNILHKPGMFLYRAANGLDDTPVCAFGAAPPVKSIGNGVTCSADLHSNEQAWRVIVELCAEVSRRLIKNGFRACGLQLTIKDCEFGVQSRQSRLAYPTMRAADLARHAMSIFTACCDFSLPVRSITVCAFALCGENDSIQQSLFTDCEKQEKLERLEQCVYGVRERYGKRAVVPAVTLPEPSQSAPRRKIPLHKNEQAICAFLRS